MRNSVSLVAAAWQTKYIFFKTFSVPSAEVFLPEIWDPNPLDANFSRAFLQKFRLSPFLCGLEFFPSTHGTATLLRSTNPFSLSKHGLAAACNGVDTAQSKTSALPQPKHAAVKHATRMNILENNMLTRLFLDHHSPSATRTHV